MGVCRQMNRAIIFLLLAACVETLALLMSVNPLLERVLEGVVALVGLYLIVLAVRGWRRQGRLELPQVMQGRVVRKRHWHLF